MGKKIVVGKNGRSGTIFVLISALLYSFGGLFMKVIPWNGLAINGVRNLLAMLVVGSYIFLSGRKLKFNRWVLLGAFGVCSTTMLYSLANKLTTAANTIVLQFTAPIFVIVLHMIFFKKKPARLDIIACVLVLAGVVCFFVDGISMGGMLGNFLALLSGATYSIVFMLNDLPDGDPLSSVFFGNILSSLIGAPFLARETDFSVPVILGILFMGLLQVGVAYVCMCIGLETTPAVSASLISGIEPILNPIWVAIFYHEKVGGLALAGAAIVICSVVGYNVARERIIHNESTNINVYNKGETV